MKKLFVASLIAIMAFSVAAQAEVEISGNVTTVTLYQMSNSNAIGGFGGVIGTGGATQGDFGFVDAASDNQFRFLVDQVELDLENEFGENIRARADLDFRDFGVGTAGNTQITAGDLFDLEQAYVTANIAAGNGIEILVGKFNAPLGLEGVDRHMNVFSTYTPGWFFLTPKSVAGAKLYYEFNEHWNIDVALVNNLNSASGGIAAFTDSGYPSGILRIGAIWGAEGNESFVNLGGGFGPETPSNSDLDMLFQLWGNWALGDYWDLGWSAEYRTTKVTATMKAYSGQLYAVWEASDAWTLQLRAAALFDANTAGVATGSTASTTATYAAGALAAAGNWGAFEGKTYSGSLGTTYKITDGANLKIEYRFDYATPDAAGAGKAQYHTGIAELAYSF